MQSLRVTLFLLLFVALVSMQRIRFARAFLLRPYPHHQRCPASRTCQRSVVTMLPTQQRLRYSPCNSLFSNQSLVRPSLLALASKTATKQATTTSVSHNNNNNNNKRPYQLVIVESPSKCKTISNILENYVQTNDLPYDYIVESCMGHVRNLPKSASDVDKKTAVVGVDVDHAYQPTYVLLPGKQTLVKKLTMLAKNADKVILATDEDREGEAVAWHLQQVLDLDESKYERVTFTEITPTAIEASIQHPSTLNLNLVQAQETRRILDRLAGYTLSPILWKKIAPGLSAGRVQSVGMALIVQRERERLLFHPVEYWDMQAELLDGNEELNATLTSVNNVTVASGSDFDNQGQLVATNKRHFTQDDIQELRDTLLNNDDTTWTVVSIQSRERKQSPPMPFTTSTLQQEANKRLGMSVSQTMQCAQSLYESGFISYMRTDSTTLSDDAQKATATMVSKDYGKNLVAAPRKGKQSKNAQEAHEAIRPAIQSNGGYLRPDQLKGSNKDVTLKLYDLIYRRTVASRMVPQVVNSTSISIQGDNGDTTALFRVSGSVVLAPGYTLALGRSSTDTMLPPLKEGQVLECKNLTCVSHTTQPPPRYNEASFVKELEACGVGRPSTYAGTVQILRDRAYVGTPLRADETGRRNTKTRTGSAISAQRAAGGEDFTGGGRGPLVPSLSAFVVCSLLENHCKTYVDPGFTATMEERLDQIARGEEGAERVAYLDEFYAGDNGLAAKVKYIEDTVPAEEARRATLPSLFLNNTDDTDEIGLFIGPWGPYVQKIESNGNDTKPSTVNLPAGMASDLSTITPQTLRTLLSSRERNGELMGMHPDDGRPVRLKLGPYGAYLQWGDDDEEGTTTHSLPKHIGSVRLNTNTEDGDRHASLSSMIGLSWEDAVGYVSLPRTVCTMNDLPIIAAIGPYGPYLKYNNSFVSLNKRDGDVLTVDEETAQRVVTDGIINKKSKMGQGIIAELGEKDGSMVKVKDGRYGVYINWRKVNAKLPVEYADNPETLPLEEAWSLIQEKSASGGGRTKQKSTSEVELPPAPKRPKSAYLYFCAEKRPQVAETVKSLGDVSKELARLWAETTDRRPYEEMAAAGKQEYEQLKVEWQKECQELLTKSSSSSTKKRNGVKKQTTLSPGPKRPKSAYLFFCADKRPEVSKTAKSLGDISKELARLWAETEDNPEERQKYQDLADEDKKRYEQEVLQVSNNKVNNVNGKVASSKRKSSIKKQSSKKTSNRAPSAYMLFCSEYRKTIVDDQGNKLPFGETTKRLAQMWKECDAETKTRFQEQAAEEKTKLLQSSPAS